MTTSYDFIGFLKENYVLLLSLGGIFIVAIGNEWRNREIKKLLCIAVGLLVIAVMQYVERWLGCQEEPVIGRYVLSALVYAGYPFLVAAVFWEMTEASRRIWILIPAVANALCCAVDIFGVHLIFSFDEHNLFNRGPLGCLPFIVSGLYVIWLMVTAMRHINGDYRIKNHLFLYIGVSICVSVLLESINVVTAVNTVGMLDILLYMHFLTFQIRFDMERNQLVSENVRLSSEKALADSKTSMLQHQIHRHFIYNSMVALKSLCRRDPVKAENFVQDLADYLRVNLETMTEERLVEFSKEREYIRQYLAIEQADPASHFQVLWDVGTENFLLPALSIEPLVENSVQHGVADSALDGYVKISTHEEKDRIIVEVEDNGIGFEPKVSEEEQKKLSGGQEKDSAGKHGGIGIENTRLRLAAIGGTLSVKSDEYGTIAHVEIPKKVREEKTNENIGIG